MPAPIAGSAAWYSLPAHLIDVDSVSHDRPKRYPASDKPPSTTPECRGDQPKHGKPDPAGAAAFFTPGTMKGIST